MAVEGRKTSGLGRGLAALIPPAPSGVSGTHEIAIDAIGPNPDQPRRDFDQLQLESLAGSIAMHGVLQPIIVVQHGDRYILIAGERRWRAGKLAGLRTIPAVVRTANEQARLELALVENIQRAELNALEEAQAYRHLIDDFGLTQERVAERIGRSRPTVANTLRILDTAPLVQQAVADGTISGGHAKALAGLERHSEQEVVLSAVVARALSVRQTERLVAATHDLGEARGRAPERARDPDLQHMEARMREALGTKVTIAPGRKGGRITITWFDDEDLGRLVDRLATS
jgi:ParB family chromosome partitioning protein